MPSNDTHKTIIPTPWWRRAGVRVGLVLPAFIRRRMGLYRWDELLSASPANLLDAAAYEDGNGIPPVRPRIHRGVQKLVAAGISFPSGRAPWPHALENGAASWNKDIVWAYSDEEFVAWMKIWKGHKHKQNYIDQALAVAAANANVNAFGLLIDEGANPEWEGRRHGKVLDRLFSSSRVDNVLACLVHLAPTQSKWSWQEPDFYPRRWSVAKLSKMEALGIRLPVSWQLMWAQSSFNDPPFSGQDRTEMLEAAKIMQWWWSPDRLGSVEGARGQLLETWISSIRPGTEKRYQEDILHYWNALFPTSNDAIPPEPQDGTGRSWAHRWAASIFPVAVPSQIVETFLSLPSFAVDAKDSKGLTVEKLFKDRVDSQRSTPEDPEDVRAYQAIVALLQSRQLAKSTPLVLDGPAGDMDSPSKRPSRRL